jgi:hypothetical protein
VTTRWNLAVGVELEAIRLRTAVGEADYCATYADPTAEIAEAEVREAVARLRGLLDRIAPAGAPR